MGAHRMMHACAPYAARVCNGRATCVQRLLLAIVIVLCHACAAMADVRQYSVADVPNVRLTDVSQYVSDPSRILSAAARDSINATLGRLERSTGIETAVVMLPSIGQADIFDFAHELFRTWGIGKKKSNNGLLILFVMDQRKIRFTTGYGIEGDMTDAVAKRIQTTVMVPHFKNSDWDGGMVEGVRAAARVLDGTMQPDADTDDDGLFAGIMVLAIVAFVIAAIVIAGEGQRCPKCRKKGALHKTDEQVLRVRDAASGRTRRIRRSTYVCRHCGHIVRKDENIDNDGSALAAGAVLGSMMGSGRGGGGTIGGSFGGGSTGGGGSTSDW